MVDTAATYDARKGLIRKFSENQQLPIQGQAKRGTLSEDGAFLAITTEGHDLWVLETFASNAYYHYVSKNAKRFVWSKLKRSSLTDLAKSERVEYLAIIDEDENAVIYSLKPGTGGNDDVGQLKSQCVQLIPSSVLSSRLSDEEAKITSVILVSATHDDLQKTHGITCIVDDRELVKIVFEDGKDKLHVDAKVPLPYIPQEVPGCRYFQQKDSLIVSVAPNQDCYIIDVDKGRILQCFAIAQDPEVPIHDGRDVEDISGNSQLTACAISDDLSFIVIVDRSGQFFIIYTHIDQLLDLEDEKKNSSKQKVLDSCGFLPIENGVQDSIWANELAIVKQEFMYQDMLDDAGLLQNHYESFSDLSKDTLTHHSPLEDDNISLQNVLYEKEQIDIPAWTSDFIVADILPDKNSILVTFKPKSSKRAEPQSPAEHDELYSNFLLLYDIQSRDSALQRIPDDAIVAVSQSRFFPHCILTHDMLYLPTFNTSQEQLFSGFIQYSGISEAEQICRSNQWNHFSIPLHSLEVGLQHRQIDTISFFLKTRDKAFSRYWRSISLPETSAMQPESETSETATSPSLKALFPPSMVTSSVDPSELHKAVDMLIKSIHQNSKGQHKKNFFEALLRMTIDFLNNMIRDGVEVLETIDCQAAPSQMSSEEGRKSFTFVVDIPDSIAYLVECLMEIRRFIPDLPAFHTRKDDQTSSPEIKLDVNKPLKAYVEEEVLAGRLSHLQQYIINHPNKSEAEKICDGSLPSLIAFGLKFAFRLLLNKNIEQAVRVVKNLGMCEIETLRKIFEFTLDKDLREYLISELQARGMLTEQDHKDVEYLHQLEAHYPCHVVEEACKSKKWTSLLGEFQDDKTFSAKDNSKAVCNSLRKQDKKESVTEGNYSELMLKWVQLWEDASRTTVLLDAAMSAKNPVNIRELVTAENFWEYLICHNAESAILSWIQSSKQPSSKMKENGFPAFDASLIGKFSSATSYIQRKAFFECIKNGIYTDEMIQDFPMVLKVISEASTLFGFPENFILDEELRSKFHFKFIDYCLQNDLKEVLFLYLEHHSLYPGQKELQDQDISIADYPWLAFMLSLRNLHRDEFGSMEMSLSNAATVFNAPEKTVADQLCIDRPLIVLATMLLSSFQFREVFNGGETARNFNIDVPALKTAILPYDLLHSAVFSKVENDQTKRSLMYRLLQDNTRVNAINFFSWQLGCSQKDHQLPHFSSPELVQNYGLVIQVKYPYYLKQGRPIYAYLAYMKDAKQTTQGKDERKRLAFKSAYKIAVANFDKEAIVCACAVFLDVIGVESWPLRVDMESANYVAKNCSASIAGQTMLPAGKNLRSSIVSCLKNKNQGRQRLLQMLEESVQNALLRESIDRTSYDAIMYWRIPIQFAQTNKLRPPVAFISECAENGRWFQAIVFIQVYQFEQSQVLTCLEKHLKNSILKEHLLAVIKNAKKISSGNGDKKMAESKSSKKPTKQKQATRRDFRAQFYFSLEKGVEKRPGDEKERLAPVRTNTSGLTQEQNVADKKLQKASAKTLAAYEQETGAQSGNNINGGRIDAANVNDDVLNILLECEESGHPCRELMSCAFTLSQPFLIVLAACYQSADLVDCLCAWLILNFRQEKRLKILKKFNDMDQERYQWRIESLFIILSDLIESEDDAAKIIAQGFRIFLDESSLLHFFTFYESFTSKLGMDVCSKQLALFSQSLKEEISDEREASLIRIFFIQKIPIKILLKCRSKFYQRKLLQLFTDAGFGSFQMSSVISLERMSTICKNVQHADISIDFTMLVSDDQSQRSAEEERIFSLLLENGDFETATSFAKTCNLPLWKVSLFKTNQELEQMRNSTLWLNSETRLNFWLKSDDLFTQSDVSSSIAGSFFQSQAEELSDLSYDERALLLSIAFRWFKDERDVACSESHEAFLNKLEKQIWMLKIKSEIEKNTQEKPRLESSTFHMNLSRRPTYDPKNLLSRGHRSSSAITVKHTRKSWELLQSDDLDWITSGESSSSLDESEMKAFESLVGELLDKCEVTQARRICAFFGKTAPDLEYVLSSIFLAQGTKQIEDLDENVFSVISKGPGHSLSFTCGSEGSVVFSRSASFQGLSSSPGKIMHDWVMIDELQNALEKLCSKCKRGRKCCERVLVCFKISKMLGEDYADIVKKEQFTVLRELIYSGMDKRRQVCKQFIKAFALQENEVAAFVAEVVTQWLKITCNYDIETSNTTQSNMMLENSFTSEDMKNFIQLVEKPSALGLYMLEAAKAVSVLEDSEKNSNSLSYQAELLIRAHDCFTLSCNMEGISEVLRAARLCTLDLVKAQAYSVMVRVLTGIGRFKEMTYVFEALSEQYHFELLFRKNIEKEKQLKAALLDFIKKFHPDDTEKMDMLSKRFGMYREVGEQLEETGHKQIRLIKDKIKGNKKEVEPGLIEIAKTFSYAADNYVKVDCLQRSSQCRKLARLAELQIRLFVSGDWILGLEKHKVNQLLCRHADFYEALVIANAYGLNSATVWVDPLYQIVIKKGDMSYLKQYLSVFQLPASVMMEIASRYRSEPVNSQMGENLRKTLSHVKEVKLRYKIAHELNLHDVIKQLLKGPAGAFLRDTVFTYS